MFCDYKFLLNNIKNKNFNDLNDTELLFILLYYKNEKVSLKFLCLTYKLLNDFTPSVKFIEDYIIEISFLYDLNYINDLKKLLHNYNKIKKFNNLIYLICSLKYSRLIENILKLLFSLKLFDINCIILGKEIYDLEYNHHNTFLGYDYSLNYIFEHKYYNLLTFIRFYWNFNDFSRQYYENLLLSFGIKDKLKKN